MDNVKLISKSDVQNVLSMKKAIEIVEKVYQAHGRDPVSYTHLDVYKRQVFFLLT